MDAEVPTARGPIAAIDVAVAAQLACLLEASAPKPGNVSPGRDFADARYEDFLASAAAIGGPLSRAGTRSVGATVKDAIEATARWTSSNTNLGIVLLLTPLARAADAGTVRLKADTTETGAHAASVGTVRLKADTTETGAHAASVGTVRLKADTTETGARAADAGTVRLRADTTETESHAASVGTVRLKGDSTARDTASVVSGFSRTLRDAVSLASGFSRNLRDALRVVLDETTIDDTRDVYAAIRQAAPGGLGHAEAQDVKDEPTIALVEAMRLAADRDGIAREYATAFETTFEIGVPTLVQARTDQLSWNDAIVETFLTLLARAPDTHITRRGGAPLAAEVSSRARNVLEEGGVRSTSGQRAIAGMDRALRDADHLANPGTTADLTAASIFVVLLGDGWRIR